MTLWVPNRLVCGPLWLLRSTQNWLYYSGHGFDTWKVMGNIQSIWFSLWPTCLSPRHPIVHLPEPPDHKTIGSTSGSRGEIFYWWNSKWPPYHFRKIYVWSYFCLKLTQKLNFNVKIYVLNVPQSSVK